MIRTLVVDDHPVVLEGLTALLTADPDIVVVGEAGTGPAAIVAADRLRPRVAVIDVQLPGIDGYKTCGDLRSRGWLSVVLITSSPSAASLHRAEAAGAVGYVGKASPPHALRQAVRAAAEDHRYVDPSLRHLDARVDAKGQNLDPVDYRILALLAAGRTNREIASELKVSYSTVKHRVSSLIHRLGARRRTDLVAAAGPLAAIAAVPSQAGTLPRASVADKSFRDARNMAIWP